MNYLISPHISHLINPMWCEELRLVTRSCRSQGRPNINVQLPYTSGSIVNARDIFVVLKDGSKNSFMYYIKNFTETASLLKELQREDYQYTIVFRLLYTAYALGSGYYCFPTVLERRISREDIERRTSCIRSKKEPLKDTEIVAYLNFMDRKIWGEKK